jgi:hypothetical protein
MARAKSSGNRHQTQTLDIEMMLFNPEKAVSRSPRFEPLAVRKSARHRSWRYAVETAVTRDALCWYVNHISYLGK